MITEDFTEVAAMVVPVHLFAFLGLEHSVADSVLRLVYGFQYGIDVAGALGNVDA